MPLFKRVDTLFGESGGTPLHQEFQYKANLFMTQKDQVFVVDVMVNDLTRKMVVSSVIN
jgi:hypothetical protein